MYEAATRYWYIKLPAEWQRARDDIVSIVRDEYSDSAWYTESEQLCLYWNDQINTVHPHNKSPPVVRCVPPPSVVGVYHLHSTPHCG